MITSRWHPYINQWAGKYKWVSGWLSEQQKEINSVLKVGARVGIECSD